MKPTRRPFLLRTALLATTAAVCLPLMTSTAPADAATAPAPAGSAAPPTPAAPAADKPKPTGEITRNSSVKITIDPASTRTIHLQRFYPHTGKWETKNVLKPGQTAHHSWDCAARDDLEFRFWYSPPTADSKDYHEVDIDNPAFTQPWLSVNWDREYFSTNESRHYWPGDQELHEYWAKRDHDSETSINWQLRYKGHH